MEPIVPVPVPLAKNLSLEEKIEKTLVILGRVVDNVDRRVATHLPKK